MKRQLYFLLPDVEHTKELCNELKDSDIEEKNLHVVVDNKYKVTDININDVHSFNESDREYLLESLLWKANLAVFGLALIVSIGLISWNQTDYLIIPLIIMLAALIGGFYFAMRMPNVHWNEFTTAINNGEVLLIIDAPKRAIQYIEKLVRRGHPEAVTGGVCWKL